MGIPDLMSIHDELQIRWNEDLDAEHSRYVARKALPALARSLDPPRDLPGVALAAEVLWDTLPASQESLDLVGEYRVAASSFARSLPPEDGLSTINEALVLSARAWHRVNPGGNAVGFVLEAQRRLIRAAGSRAELCRRAALPNGDPLGGQFVSVLAIGIPATRVAAQKSPNILRLRDSFIQDAKTIFRLAPNPFQYPRLYALASQSFFAVADQPNTAEDDDLLVRIEQVIGEVRPDHARAQASRRLIDVSLAKYRGDTEAEAIIGAQALEDILSAGLRRHGDVLVKRGWIRTTV